MSETAKVLVVYAKRDKDFWLIKTKIRIQGKTHWVTRQEWEDCEFFNKKFYPLSKDKPNKKTIIIKDGWE